mmetsp:Transcript_42209/g.69551  ORF Transcript_42209/g.69551 Transcript_42209/m.69551 type:complete len:392 (+) Transcript_42209:37-1212(+)
MPKRLARKNDRRNTGGKKKKTQKVVSKQASFPDTTSKLVKYELDLEKSLASKNTHNNTVQSKQHAKRQQKQHQTFVQRQNDISVSPHHRIQELLRKSKKRKHNKPAAAVPKTIKKRSNKKMTSLAALRQSQLSTANANANTDSETTIGPLHGAQFRWMNEMLYNTSGRDAQTRIREHENEFIDYHKTYNEIVSNEWPESPLEKIIKSITKKLNNLYRFKHGSAAAAAASFTIADFGCGDAKIAKYFATEYKQTNHNKNVCVQVHSFDLMALNEFVTECDISNVPLSSDSVDLAVFCLSLMGTNFHEYLLEAYRVLRKKGYLKIAEVRSRFYSITRFEKLLFQCGFDVVAKELDNTHFALFHCTKSDVRNPHKLSSNYDAKTVLKPCVYKKR